MTEPENSFNCFNKIEGNSQKCMSVKKEFSNSECYTNDNKDNIQNDHKSYEITFVTSDMKNEKLSDESTCK